MQSDVFVPIPPSQEPRPQGSVVVETYALSSWEGKCCLIQKRRSPWNVGCVFYNSQSRCLNFLLCLNVSCPQCPLLGSWKLASLSTCGQKHIFHHNRSTGICSSPLKPLDKFRSLQSCSKMCSWSTMVLHQLGVGAGSSDFSDLNWGYVQKSVFVELVCGNWDSWTGNLVLDIKSL